MGSSSLRILALVPLAALTIFLGGCAEDSGASDPNRVSTLPWSRPERWEGQGAIGGMMPQGR
jgi:hypothetical protein